MAVATLRTRRRRWRFLMGEMEMAELANDEVSVVEGRRIVSRFRELELEAIEDDAPLEDLAEQLRVAGATDAEPIPKVVRALGSRATAHAGHRAGGPAVGADDRRRAGRRDCRRAAAPAPKRSAHAVRRCGGTAPAPRFASPPAE